VTREDLYFKPTEPYVLQRQSPLGWVVELFDPTLPADRQLVRSERPDRKVTAVYKRQMIASYKRSRGQQ
jgi:hypothetical protein